MIDFAKMDESLNSYIASIEKEKSFLSFDIQKVNESLISNMASIASIKTETSFLSIEDHKQQIKEKKLSYDELLSYAACYTADYELNEFENKSLKKLLETQEVLLSASQELEKMQETNYKKLLEISKMHELVTTTERFITGQFQGRDTQKKIHGVNAANALHSKPGGSREKREAIRAIWATGKYSKRDICAEQECAALEMSFSTARKALIGMPDPA